MASRRGFSLHAAGIGGALLSGAGAAYWPRWGWVAALAGGFYLIILFIWFAPKAGAAPTPVAFDALLRSEERLRLALEAGKTEMWDCDLATHRRVVSSGYQGLFGHGDVRENQTLEDFLQSVHPEDRQRVAGEVQLTRSQGGHFTTEFRVLWPNGQTRWLMVAGQVITDALGQPLRMVGICSDITERKNRQWEVERLNSDLQKRMEELQALFEVMPVAVAMVQDPQIPSMTLNAHFARLLRLPKAGKVDRPHLLGTGPQGFTLQRDGRELLPEELPIKYAMDHGAAVRGTEMDLVFSDDVRRVLYGAAQPLFDAEGKVRGAVGAFLDITDLKRVQTELSQNRQRYYCLFDHNPNAVFSLDMRGRFTEVNAACSILSGYPCEQLLKMTFKQLCVPDRLKALNDQFARSLSGHAEQTTTAIFTADGQRRELNISALPIVLEGKVVGMHGIAQDITEAMQAQLQLGEAREKAEAANRAKDRFLAVLSHELRNPLTPIMAAAAMLLEQRPHDLELLEHLELIRRNAEMSGRLIDDLLDVSRIAAGKLELHIAPVDAHLVMRRAVEVCQVELNAKSIQLRLEPLSDRPIVPVDAARLQQVLWNLLKNAIKFTPAGGMVTLRSTNAAGRLVLEVADTGIGIEPAAVNRIFNAFEQGERSVTQRFGGLGLGLTISKNLVEAHGGTLTAYSEGKDQGSVFIVDLPLAGVAVPAGAAPAGIAPAGTAPAWAAPTGAVPAGAGPAGTAPAWAAPAGAVFAGVVSAGAAPPGVAPAGIAPAVPLPASAVQPQRTDRKTRGRRILLVEDHPDSLKMMTKMLTMCGHDVVAADTVAAAVAAAGRQTFDLLLSDLGLPDGNGLDLMRRLKNEYALRGVALTGYGTAEDRQRCAEAGFEAQLTKPVNLDQLKRVISELTASHCGK